MSKDSQIDLYTPSTLSSASPRAAQLTSLLKWAGGKEQELKYILPLVPPFDAYYEPFVGGGAVFFALAASQKSQKFINDKSPDLVNLYRMVAHQDAVFLQTLDSLLASWQRISTIVDSNAAYFVHVYQHYAVDELDTRLFALLHANAGQFETMFAAIWQDTHNFFHEIGRNVASKTRRMKEIERRCGTLPDDDIVANIESALKSAFYMHLRHLYNNISSYGLAPAVAAAIFFFVRENAYASMFRYNSKGDFNVPYGGITYNRKGIARKIACMRSAGTQAAFCNTTIDHMDFEAFLRTYPPQAGDFVFLDPPYDSEFSTYTQNAFGRQDQERLACYLLQQCQAQFMLVIKSTPTILDLYASTGLTLRTFEKRYMVSFQDRNNREAKHLIITNF